MKFLLDAYEENEYDGELGAAVADIDTKFARHLLHLKSSMEGLDACAISVYDWGIEWLSTWPDYMPNKSCIRLPGGYKVGQETIDVDSVTAVITTAGVCWEGYLGNSRTRVTTSFVPYDEIEEIAEGGLNE